MNNVLTQIKIDLYSSTSYKVIQAQQGDKNSRVIEFVLYNQDEPYEFTDNIFFRFVGHRGDGSSFSKTEQECITRKGNLVKVTLPEDVLYYDGTIEAKLVMYELGDSAARPAEPRLADKLPERPERTVLSTIPFKISCIKNPCNENNLSEGELSIVTDLLFQMEEFSRNAQDVIDQAQASADKAKDSEDNAKSSENAAKTSELNAANSEANALIYKDTAVTKAAESASSALLAKTSETNADLYAKKSQSYAVGGTGTRAGEDNDCAKRYYEQAKAISESFAGALRPMGTVTFANLPALASASEGDMYNISDQFTTNENFKEGSELVIPAGSNVYKTADDKWDVLAGSPVASVNGQTGNVNITKANIELGNVDNTADKDKSVKSAKTLSNARTIFGKSFNGSQNVAGQGLFYGTPTDPPSSRYRYGGLQIVENNNIGNASKDIKYAPSIGFHWGNVIAASLAMDSSGVFHFFCQDGVTPAILEAKATRDGDGNVIKDSYAVRKTINNDDFNNVKIPGLYTMRNCTNSPGGNYMGLIVLNSDNEQYVEQIAFQEHTFKIYIRNLYDDSGWSSWKALITEDNLLDKTYPIGSIYMSVNSTSPATLFGGTWVRWGNGRVPVGVDTSQTEFSTVGKTGGKKTHILTTSEIPGHTHAISAQTVYTTYDGSHGHRLAYSSTAAVGGSAARVNGSGTLWSGDNVTEHNGAHSHNVTIPEHTANSNSGGGGAHNNLQPYITCYMWKRTA